MSDNNLENWEQELKNKLGNHQEATDAKDLEAFMGKLEKNNFFNEGGNKFSGKWSVLTGLLIAGIAYLMITQVEPEVKQKIVPIKKQGVEVDKKIKVKEIIVAPVKLEETKEIQEPKGTLLTEPSVSEQEPVVVKHTAAAVMKEERPYESVIEVIDTVEQVNDFKEKPIVNITPRKPIIIMSTDTTVVKDTSHVKHRKRDKKKKR
jgi:hypothetical protein